MSVPSRTDGFTSGLKQLPDPTRCPKPMSADPPQEVHRPTRRHRPIRGPLSRADQAGATSDGSDAQFEFHGRLRRRSAYVEQHLCRPLLSVRSQKHVLFPSNASAISATNGPASQASRGSANASHVLSIAEEVSKSDVAFIRGCVRESRFRRKPTSERALVSLQPRSCGPRRRHVVPGPIARPTAECHPGPMTDRPHRHSPAAVTGRRVRAAAHAAG